MNNIDAIKAQGVDAVLAAEQPPIPQEEQPEALVLFPGVGLDNSGVTAAIRGEVIAAEQPLVPREEQPEALVIFPGASAETGDQVAARHAKAAQPEQPPVHQEEQPEVLVLPPDTRPDASGAVPAATCVALPVQKPADGLPQRALSGTSAQAGRRARRAVLNEAQEQSQASVPSLSHNQAEQLTC